MININEHNRKAWDIHAKMNGAYSQTLNEEELIDFKSDPYLKLIPGDHIPSSWPLDVKGKEVLLLAGGGGLQSLKLATLGANVTVVDISSEQLKKDELIATQKDLSIKTIQTSAEDLTMIKDLSFDYIINPCSSCFFENLDAVWCEVSRVLKPKGILYYAFINPISYLFDWDKKNKGEYTLKYQQPYSDQNSLNEEERKRFIGAEVPMEFSHSFSQQVGLLLRQGLVLKDLTESNWEIDDPLNEFFPQFVQCYAEKL